MSQAKICDHCGQAIAENDTHATVSWALQSSQEPTGGQLDFHAQPNADDSPTCFDAVRVALASAVQQPAGA